MQILPKAENNGGSIPRIAEESVLRNTSGDTKYMNALNEIL